MFLFIFFLRNLRDYTKSMNTQKKETEKILIEDFKNQISLSEFVFFFLIFNIFPSLKNKIEIS